jgi:hypothetical protein
MFNEFLTLIHETHNQEHINFIGINAQDVNTNSINTHNNIEIYKQSYEQQQESISMAIKEFDTYLNYTIDKKKYPQYQYTTEDQNYINSYKVLYLAPKTHYDNIFDFINRASWEEKINLINAVSAVISNLKSYKILIYNGQYTGALYFTLGVCYKQLANVKVETNRFHIHIETMDDYINIYEIINNRNNHLPNWCHEHKPVNINVFDTNNPNKSIDNPLIKAIQGHNKDFLCHDSNEYVWCFRNRHSKPENNDFHVLACPTKQYYDILDFLKRSTLNEKCAIYTYVVKFLKSYDNFFIHFHGSGYNSLGQLHIHLSYNLNSQN